MWARRGDFFNAATLDADIPPEIKGGPYRFCATTDWLVGRLKALKDSNRLVTFYCVGSPVIIKEIGISHDPTRKTVLFITPFAPMTNEIVPLITQGFPETKNPEEPYDSFLQWYLGSRHINLTSWLTLFVLFRLFDFINKKYEFEVIPVSIYSELSNIYKYIYSYGDNGIPAHIIPERIFTPFYINPTRTYSDELLRTFDTMRSGRTRGGQRRLLLSWLDQSKKQKCKLNRLLADGENPDQIDERKRSVFFYLLDAFVPGLHDHNYKEVYEMLESLIVYGGSIFQPVDNHSFETPIEVAYKLLTKTGHTEPYQIITSALSSITKSIMQVQNPDTRFHVASCNVEGKENTVITRLVFKNGVPITAVVRHLCNLTEDELSEIYEVYIKYFSSDKGKVQIKYEFDKAFRKSTNKFVECIYANNILIGFTLFEIMKKDVHKVILHIEYIVMHPAFRGGMLMKFLMLRFAYSLQALLKDDVVAIFVNAVHYNGFRMMKDWLYFPRHQHPDIERLVKSILQDIYQDKLQYHHDTEDPQACYVAEDLHVVTTRTTSENRDLLRDYFLYHVLGVDRHVGLQQSRSVPMLSFISSDNFNELLRLCYIFLDINFGLHIAMLANVTKLFLSQYVPVTDEPQLSYIQCRTATFFGTKSVNAETTVTSVYEGIPLARL